jgi:hypothetical protein
VCAYASICCREICLYALFVFHCKVSAFISCSLLVFALSGDQSRAGKFYSYKMIFRNNKLITVQRQSTREGSTEARGGASIVADESANTTGK